MVETPPDRHSPPPTLSATSSGGATMRPSRRRRSSGLASQESCPESSLKLPLEQQGQESPLGMVAPVYEDPLQHAAWVSENETSTPQSQRPPPLWRQASSNVFNDHDMTNDGPSDYWHRPSPTLAPEPMPSHPPRDPWLRSSNHTHTSDEEVENDDEEGHADTAEYSKRLEQVLSQTQAAQHSSPIERRARALTRGETPENGSDDEGWADYRPPSEQDYQSAVKGVLAETRPQDVFGDDKGEEEFGVLGHRSGSDAPVRTPSATSLSMSIQDRVQSPMRASPSGPSRSYIHPSVSRLRSQPHARSLSSSTILTTQTTSAHARIPSHFSQVSLSRSDSFSAASLGGAMPPPAAEEQLEQAPSVFEDIKGPAFTFHSLRKLSAHLFNRTRRENGADSPTPRPSPSRKAGSVLGITLGSRDQSQIDPNTGNFGHPTVMDVNGMIAAGTDKGYVLVYGFGQDVRFVLGTDLTGETLQGHALIPAATSGPVTAVAISPDQTWIGVGHASGNIYLYDLSNPVKPARTTLALPLAQVLSGRKEGHLQGSRILHIGFVGKRHTSIVTADEDGRAFWFSLGRVMGVDSNDVVRMLGSYPDREPEPERDSHSRESTRPDDAGSAPESIRSHTPKKTTTLFAALPLPLGAQPHPTDGFHISALLTPVKLVVVGMKPSPKTWFRKMRDTAGGDYGGFVGCAAWLRSGEVSAGTSDRPPSDPVLAYSWGTSLRFLRVRIGVTNPLERVVLEGKSDKKPAPIKTPEFIEGRRWESPHPILSLHWFDSDHMLILTDQELVLLNVRSMSPLERTPFQTKLLTSHDFHSSLSLRRARIDAVPESIASSARTFRDKLFLLTKANVQVGTLQHWNDRILANVHRGDFLAAISLALAYYEGRATGNTMGLPEDATARRQVVGARVRELMRASLEWAFSEDRMHDDTHFSVDGRGVDLTFLFEGLATACIDACLAMGDLNFLFDDTYEHFAEVGIQGIFLTHLEQYLFDGRLHDVPPHVAQALIAMHDDKGEYALAEAVIWHIAPSSLDINQAITLCEKHGLWDALIYVYTQAMADYTAPIVKLVGIVCHILRARRDRPSLVRETVERSDVEERLAPDAYKLYAYVANVLCGLWYPSGEPMPEPEATRARQAAYDFLFADRNVDWPQGSDDLVLTDGGATGGVEPPYPYLRLLLAFDAEAFLHAMDLAFEDPYLNDPSRPINRQSIINLMLDIMNDGFHSSDVTFLHIFVARNLPKYPQFIFIPPSTSHRILVSLAEDPDQSTREDRQLAAEYLLSAYTPHNAGEMMAQFERAGFFRILRAAYRRNGKWGSLVETLLKDPDTDDSVFTSLDEIIADSKSSGGVVPDDVVNATSNALSHLFDLSVRQTAALLDRSLPGLHAKAISTLDSSPVKQAAYLRSLFDPSSDDAESEGGEELERVQVQPSVNLGVDARHKYVSLLARQEPSLVLGFLDAQSGSAFDLSRLAAQLEAEGVPEGQLWALDRAGCSKQAFETVESVLATQGSDLAQSIHSGSEGDVHVALTTLASVAHMAIRLCREHSNEGGDVEDMWFDVLHAFTDLVHGLSRINHNMPGNELAEGALESVRALVQETLHSLLSTSSPHLSFARLFKRLVEAAPKGGKLGTGTEVAKGGARVYSEFRAILSGMLDSFRQESDVLALSIRLVDTDMFDLLDSKVAKSQAGWCASVATCVVCDQPLWRSPTEKVDIRADGTSVHAMCHV